MEYCKKCKKEIDTQDEKCPVCGEKLVEILSGEDVATIAATTLLM